MSTQLDQIEPLMRAEDGDPCSWLGPYVEVRNSQSVPVSRAFLPEAASASATSVFKAAGEISELVGHQVRKALLGIICGVKNCTQGVMKKIIVMGYLVRFTIRQPR